MGFTYHFDRARNEAFAVAEGTFTAEDMREYVATERRTGSLSHISLIDGRAATPDFSAGDVRAIVTTLRELAKDSPLGPTAVVVGSEVAYGMMRMLEILVGEVCVIRPFRDLDEARTWVAQMHDHGA